MFALFLVMWCVQSGESLGSVASLLERHARAVDLPSPTALSSLTAQLPQVDLGALGAGLGGVGEQVGIFDCACKRSFFEAVVLTLWLRWLAAGGGVVRERGAGGGQELLWGAVGRGV